MQITPNLTAAELRNQGAEAFDSGEPIYEASIRSGLCNAELLELEAGYFARQRELELQAV